MRLSDAIRVGCGMNPPARHVIKRLNGSTCVWGAAAEGAGLEIPHQEFCMMEPVDILGGALKRLWPMAFAEWEDAELYCPVIDHDYFGSITDLIVHLNDEHRWSREKIAGWLDESMLMDDPKPATEIPAEIKGSTSHND